MNEKIIQIKNLYKYLGKLEVLIMYDENNSILRLALGHNNQRISKAKYEGIIRSDMSSGDFDTLMIMKDDIPFWFECPNMDIFHIDPNDKEELDLKIASFANSIEIIDPNAKSDDKDDKLKFADESYISDFQNNPVNAFVSGVIKDFKIESNSVSGESYYVIDIDCLGLYFSLLVDSEMIDVTEIEVGKIARGVFYNTALLVADNHPDYF